jgi:hypothetical protein
MQKHKISAIVATGMLLPLAISSAAIAQTTTLLSPTPKTVTMAQLKNIGALEGQLVQLSALVRHTDTAQVFTFGEKQGPEVHVIVPKPATDAAHVGDTVSITGFVRHFNGRDFERDYSWFRQADYPDVKSGDWVIVATSVTTTEGTQLVPPGVISNTPPAGKTPY